VIQGIKDAATADDSEASGELGVCECLDSHGQSVEFPVDGEPFVTYTVDGEDFEYPANYGSGVCAAWDSGLEPYCADDSETYCAAQWCFVSSECEASDTTVSNLNAEIAYSYATCGDMADFPDVGEVADEEETEEEAEVEFKIGDGVS